MKHQRTVNPHLIFAFSVFLFLASCNTKKTIPFPENPSGYKVPIAKPFEFPEAKRFQWKEIPKDSVPKGVTIPFDIRKLPSKSFSINDFKPLKSPLTSTPLNWDKLDEVKINLDTIKGKPFKVKKFRLPEPTVTRYNAPIKWAGTTSSILSLGQAEGLIGNQVHAIVEDSLGTIWISTERGLTKYSGDVFETYNFFTKDQSGSIELISDIEIAKDGNLLVTGFISGLYKVNITSEIVERYEIGERFLRIQEDHTGVIWLTNLNNKGVFFLAPGDSSINQIVLPKDKIEEALTFGVIEDTENNIWIGYRNKLAIINAERNSIRLIGKQDGLSINAPYEFTEDSKDNVWISAFSKNAYSISLKEDKIFKLGAEQGFFGAARHVVFDHLQRAWIIDNDSVSVFDPAAELIKKIPAASAFRVNNHPAKTIIDSNGTIWMGTNRTGILLVDSKGMLAEHFNESNGLANNDVWGIAEDKYKRVWIATYNGINIYDPAQEKLYWLKLPENASSNNHRKLNLLDENQLLVGSRGGFSIINLKRNVITSYKLNQVVFFGGINDHSDNLWLGANTGLFKFNPDKNELRKIDSSSGLGANIVWVLAADKEGKIWATTDKGISVIDPKENTTIFLDEKSGLNSNYTSMLFKTSKGEIMVGGDKGFVIIDQEQKLITPVTAKEGLVPESFFDMTELNGRIHIGSENGLIIMERPADTSSGKGWRFTNYGKREGFPLNDYNQGTATPTSKGKVWWGATPILTVALQDPLIDSLAPRVHITDFNIMDQNTSFLDLNYINSTLSPGDTLWSSDNLRYYIKDAFPKDSSYLAQNNISWDSLSPVYQMPTGLKLPHNINSFNISFVNPDSKGRDKIVYRYILDGADEAWTEVSPKPISKNYYNIQPGKYTFKVATRGFNGVWSKPTELSFTIVSPWWQTWWAYLLYAVSFGGAVWFTALYRSSWLKKENKILEDKVSHRTAQLKQTIEELKGTQSQLIQSEKMASLGELTAGIAHEIQNPLNFVNNFSEVNTELIAEMKEELSKGNINEAKTIADDIDENEKKIIFHGKRADGIVKGMLQHSRSSSGVKEPTDINVLADEYLRLAYHGLRAKDKSFNASMKTDFDESIGKINVLSQDLGRVILNLITNAFYAVTEKKKHALEGSAEQQYEPTVTVSTRMINNKVEIRVKDNGNGIPQRVIDKIFQPFFTTKPTGEGTGLGLSMSYDIITKSHEGEIKVETKEGEGSEFIIVLPQ